MKINCVTRCFFWFPSRVTLGQLTGTHLLDAQLLCTPHSFPFPKPTLPSVGIYPSTREGEGEEEESARKRRGGLQKLRDYDRGKKIQLLNETKSLSDVP